MQVNSATSPLPTGILGALKKFPVHTLLCSPEIRQSVWHKNYTLGLCSQTLMLRANNLDQLS